MSEIRYCINCSAPITPEQSAYSNGLCGACDCDLQKGAIARIDDLRAQLATRGARIVELERAHQKIVTVLGPTIPDTVPEGPDAEMQIALDTAREVLREQQPHEKNEFNPDWLCEKCREALDALVMENCGELLIAQEWAVELEKALKQLYTAAERVRKMHAFPHKQRQTIVGTARLL